MIAAIAHVVENMAITVATIRGRVVILGANVRASAYIKYMCIK